MAEPFDPASVAAWIARGRSPALAAILADAWRRFPDLANDSPAHERMARMRERSAELRTIMEAMSLAAQDARQARNFAFIEGQIAEGGGDDHSRAILRARELHGYDWDRAVRYAAGWYAAHAGWQPESRRRGAVDAGSRAYDCGFRAGGGNRDDVFDTARRAFAADRRPAPPSGSPSARPCPSEWPKPTDAPRPARWSRRLLLIGAPEAGLVSPTGETAVLRPALDACSGRAELTVIVVSGSGFHALDAAIAKAAIAGVQAPACSLSDRIGQQLRRLVGASDFDDVLAAAQGDDLALLDAYASALPLCRTRERTRNTPLQQRAHFKVWLDRGLAAGETIGAGHIRWGKAAKGLSGKLGEFTARYGGKVPGRGHHILIESEGGTAARGYVSASGEPLACEVFVSNRANLRATMTARLRAFGAGTRLIAGSPGCLVEPASTVAWPGCGQNQDLIPTIKASPCVRSPAARRKSDVAPNAQ